MIPSEIREMANRYVEVLGYTIGYDVSGWPSMVTMLITPEADTETIHREFRRCLSEHQRRWIATLPMMARVDSRYLSSRVTTSPDGAAKWMMILRVDCDECEGSGGIEEYHSEVGCSEWLGCPSCCGTGKIVTGTVVR